MTKVSAAVQSPTRNRIATKTITFDGSSGKGQAASNAVFFTVTGEVMILSVVPFCTTNLAEAAPTATIALGVVNSTSLFIAATTAVNIDAGEFWVDTAPDPNGVAVPAGLMDIAITQNIVAAVASQNVNGGVLRIDVIWTPLSSGASLVAA